MPMLHSPIPRSLLSCLAVLPGLIASSGCATRNAQLAEPMSQVVSAREYGFVRPANQSEKTKSASRTAQRRASNHNLWHQLQSDQPLGIASHPRVDSAVAQLKRNPRYLEQLTARAKPYLHLIVAELQDNGLPAELALLPEIESRFNPRAVSPMRAAGLWQFMPATGQAMGLEQNASYDGRHDVIASTRSAIAYLKQLNQQFDGDWALTLAAYNAGPARVRGAQRANQERDRPTDYWSLDLPAETRAYVPKLLAVAHLVAQPEHYNLTLPAVPNQPTVELVETNATLHFDELAEICHVPVATLRKLNPGFKGDRLAQDQPYTVVLPVGSRRHLLAHLRKTEQPALAGRARSQPSDS